MGFCNNPDCQDCASIRRQHEEEIMQSRKNAMPILNTKKKKVWSNNPDYRPKKKA
jgi:hypothetical protein